MNGYSMELCGVKRQLPYVDINETLAYAAFITIGDTEMVGACAKELVKKIGQADIILTAEAKGITLAHELSRLMGHEHFVVARKSVKTYMKNVIKEKVNSITTTGTQNLYLADTEIEKLKGKKVCIIDDVISTGESLIAIENLALQAGGIVVSKAAMLAEGDAANRKDIIFLQKLPLFSKSENAYTPLD